jgi:hypothetical protein
MKRRVMEPFRAPRVAKETSDIVRRSARQTDKKPNDKPHIVPFRKGIKERLRSVLSMARF